MWVCNRALALLAMMLPAVISSAPAYAADGAVLYGEHCALCHQADGKGVPYLNPPLLGSKVVAGEIEPLVRWVLQGTDPDAPPGEYENIMAGFDYLSDAELAAILTYIRTEYAHIKRPVTAADIAGAR